MTPSQEKRYAAAAQILSALLISSDKSPDDKELAAISRRAVQTANRLEKMIVRLEDPTPQTQSKAVPALERLAAIKAKFDADKLVYESFQSFTQEP